MGEAVATVYPVSMPKDNLVDIASCQKAYDAVNELFIPLKVDASSGNSTGNSIAYSTTIDDKPMDITKKKKKKKKGKKYKKCMDHESAQVGPTGCDQHIRISSLQQLNLESKTGNCQRYSQLAPFADNTSLCTLETYGCLKDATNQDGQLIAGCLCSRPLNSKQNVMRFSVKESISGKEGPKVIEKKSARKSKHGHISDLKENLSLGDLSQYTESITSSTSESSNGGRIDKNSYAGYSSRRRKVPSQSDVVDRSRSENTFHAGKENGHSLWYKNVKYNWAKTSNHIYVPKESNLLVKGLLPNDSFSSKGFPAAPIIPSAELYASSQEQMNNKQWVAHGRCCSGFSEFNSEFRQDETDGTKGLGKLKPKPETLNSSKKRAGDHKPNLPRFQSKTGLPQGEEYEIQRQLYQGKNRDSTQRSVNHSYSTSSHVQLNLPHTKMSVELDQTLLPAVQVQPYTSMKIPRTEYVQVECLHGDNIRPDFSSRVSLQKWIPVGKKDTKVLKEDVPDSCGGNAALQVDNILPVSFSSVDPEKTSSVKNQELMDETLPVDPICKKNTAYKGYAPPCNVYNGIGSQMAIKTLNASYQLQIICESIQLATGSPLAEFEKLLQLASPVVASSSLLPPCGICFQNPTALSSLCKHQVAHLSLRDVWGWYEKPGNYGLEVTAEDIDAVSFNAHFVPFLSAVQLFRRSDVSDDRGDIIELMFEFFESEPPQLRKPLYDKVRDIVKLHTSSHQVYGDPSSLDCANLENIHPASWYSVAWYPIYRIPEGNFRASFLTYHSLGHFVHRCSSTEPNKSENQYDAISPVLGLQSYNTQGEGWFHPKCSAFNSSEILKERLRTLEESALIFARGCVYKENVQVTNRQSDFEFFLSRKN
ncbi:hypothetical protein ACHQM5_003893 [Ranunculus cassubicifolius]